MKFKAGDRVHVAKIYYKNVDFYATLYKISDELWSSEYFRIANCSNKAYENCSICKPSTGRYGLNGGTYYTLATDEEDTEEPVIQRINDMYNSVPTHYKADIDMIEFCRQHFTDEEFKGAMKFNLIKYPTRLGRKDDMVKELDKIIDYAQRYKEVLENELTQ